MTDKLPDKPQTYTLTRDLEVDGESLSNFIEAGGVIKNNGYRLTATGPVTLNLKQWASLTGGTYTDNNVTTWLELQAVATGTESQRERYRDGVLPEEELLQLARAQVFVAFEEIPRWKAIAQRDLPHPYAIGYPCPGTNPRSGLVTFETADVDELGPEEWVTMKRICNLATVANLHPDAECLGLIFMVDPRTHWAGCKACKAEICRSSARVSVRWAGRDLAREYAL